MKLIRYENNYDIIINKTIYDSNFNVNSSQNDFIKVNNNLFFHIYYNNSLFYLTKITFNLTQENYQYTNIL